MGRASSAHSTLCAQRERDDFVGSHRRTACIARSAATMKEASIVVAGDSNSRKVVVKHRNNQKQKTKR